MDGGKGAFIALNPDGTEQFRDDYGDFQSSPAIDSDGTVYICSSHYEHGEDFGLLRAFGTLDPNAPSAPEIGGPKSGKTGTEYDFTFESTSPLGNDVFYWIEWGDGNIENSIGPYSSGEEITESHTWSERGIYLIKARAKDTDNLWGPWSEFKIEIPRTRILSYIWLEWLFEHYPILGRLLNLLI
jgi:hypothetical protein